MRIRNLTLTLVAIAGQAVFGAGTTYSYDSSAWVELAKIRLRGQRIHQLHLRQSRAIC